ncbi:OadG family protein [Anaerophilus nitritogenes]|uniref:OadG family protein n=1 Tax=Anaerophilus nitritogenes TaxID=2498136 RepID=UPI00101E133F|nr:OadG family protein [Anaerophilus nitritogenes]
MWELDTMGLSESLMVSGMGVAIVFLVLLSLAVAIVVVSKIIMMLGIGSESKVASPTQSVDKRDELDEETYAVLMAAVCEEIKQPPNKFRITEIKEIN